MNYEEKYNAALERAKERYSACSAPALLEYIFPELKELWDERIKREILELVSITGNENQFEEIKDWLEKQGKQKVSDSSQTCKMETLMTLDEAIKHCKEKSCDDTLCGKEHKQLAEWLTELKSYRASVTQETQKTADMVEPKFKVGDWIVLPLGIIAHVDSLNSTDYQVTTTDGKICDFKISKQDNYHLWTIADAKESDVLYVNGAPFIYKRHDKDYVYFYCGVNVGGYFIEANGIDIWDNNNKVYPATQEQRDLLFQKMTDAGYEFVNGHITRF